MSADKRTVAIERTGRLIQIVLALYLIPALLVVLAVGGFGMLVLEVGRSFIGSVHRSASRETQPSCYSPHG